jgi:uncharacterized protein (DUF58 family)
MNLTRRGVGFAFVTLALLLSAYAFRDFILSSLVLVSLLVMAAEAAWTEFATRKPSSKYILSRVGEEEERVILYPGDKSVEKVVFDKKVGGVADLWSRVNFLAIEPAVASGVGRTLHELRFSTEYAGDYSGDMVSLTVRGPIGLFSKTCSIPFAQRYIVYPRVLQVAAATVRLLGKGELGENPILMPGVGTEYYEMRAYQPGDDYRSVNWKATAREGELIVVEHMREVGSSFLLVLDARAPGFRETDRLASTFLSIANSLGAAGVDFGILVHDGEKVLDMSPQQDPRASLARALREAARLTKIDAAPEFLELVPVGITSKFAAGMGYERDSVLLQMSEVRRAELRTTLERSDPWATVARYVRETQTKSIIYVSGLYGGVQPLVELAWESEHYRDATFTVANPCDIKSDEAHARYQKLARAFGAAGVSYHRGTPVDLARKILTA